MKPACVAWVAALGLVPCAATGQPADPSGSTGSAATSEAVSPQQPGSVSSDSAESAEATPARSSAPPPLEVVIVGPKRPPGGTTVRIIRRTDMDRLGASTVVEAVEQLPSASASFGSRGERILSLRGFDQRQVMVMVDGVPVSMPYDGQLDLHKLPLGLVDHITVVQGAGSVLHGPNGLGGALNIATRDPGQGPRLVVSTETAPWSSFRASIVGNGRVGSVGAVVGANLENTLYAPMSSAFTPSMRAWWVFVTIAKRPSCRPYTR